MLSDESNVQIFYLLHHPFEQDRMGWDGMACNT